MDETDQLPSSLTETLFFVFLFIFRSLYFPSPIVFQSKQKKIQNINIILYGKETSQRQTFFLFFALKTLFCLN
jgi:hypothetical protein